MYLNLIECKQYELLIVSYYRIVQIETPTFILTCHVIGSDNDPPESARES